MSSQAKTRYAKSGSVHIAYQVVSEGPVDVVFVPGHISHLELGWDLAWARIVNRLARFARVILLDKRGTGLSDRVPDAELPTLEQRMDDVRAVMDAAGSERAALVGVSEGGAMSVLFAATHPERTTALVLYGTMARLAWAADYPWGARPEEQHAILDAIERHWGEGVGLPVFCPSGAKDRVYRESYARFERLAASPGAATALLRMDFEMDVRAVLPSVRVPTLVLHCTGDRAVPVAHGRYLAQHIAGAKLVEVSGDDHDPVTTAQADEIGDEIEGFLTGVRRGPDASRSLATVLFTDIVASTEHAADMGDQRWRELLESHDAVVHRLLERFRGRKIKSTGDGILATFDGPTRAIRCACAIRDGVGPLGIEVRAGLHAGECELMGEDVGGIAVHIGARVAARAAPGEVLVSSTVKDLVAGSGLRFTDRGTQSLRGVPGEWRLFAVEG